MLGITYWLFGPSHLLGQQLSILAFAISCIILLKILRLFGVEQYGLPILIFFGAAPSMLMFGSVTLRESFQTLFFMLAVYCGLRALVSGKKVFFVWLVISSLAMGLFHHGLVLYAVFMIVAFATWRLKKATGILVVSRSRLTLFIMLPVIVFGLFAAAPNIQGMGTLALVADNQGLEYATKYREGSSATEARASYGIELDASAWWTFLYSSLNLYVHYLFAPFPWNIDSFADTIAAIEALWRMVLIFHSIKLWRSCHGLHRNLFGLMLLLYFSMTFLWALGTTNYGTAIRHHMPSYWLILVMGGPPFIDAVRRTIKGFFCMETDKTKRWRL